MEERNDLEIYWVGLVALLSIMPLKTIQSSDTHTTTNIYIPLCLYRVYYPRTERRSLLGPIVAIVAGLRLFFYTLRSALATLVRILFSRIKTKEAKYQTRWK